MTTGYVADTGVFVWCGGPDNEKFQQLRRAVRHVGVSLVVPRRVYKELGGDPLSTNIHPGKFPIPRGSKRAGSSSITTLTTQIRSSTVMDEARRFIATETDRDEDTVEKADTALVGLAVQLLDSGEAERVVLLTTDKPAGRAAERILPRHGVDERLEYRYVSEAYLETITAREFR